mgnify:CR=1 FL=1
MESRTASRFSGWARTTTTIGPSSIVPLAIPSGDSRRRRAFARAPGPMSRSRRRGLRRRRPVPSGVPAVRAGRPGLAAVATRTGVAGGARGVARRPRSIGRALCDSRRRARRGHRTVDGAELQGLRPIRAPQHQRGVRVLLGQPPRARLSLQAAPARQRAELRRPHPRRAPAPQRSGARPSAPRTRSAVHRRRSHPLCGALGGAACGVLQVLADARLERDEQRHAGPVVRVVPAVRRGRTRDDRAWVAPGVGAGGRPCRRIAPRDGRWGLHRAPRAQLGPGAIPPARRRDADAVCGTRARARHRCRIGRVRPAAARRRAA